MTIPGEPAAPLYAVMRWVTIGKGMRYGSTYLRVATAMGCLAFLCTVMLSPYWRGHDYLGWGLLLGLGAIPLTPGQRGQEPLPGQHEPRVPYTAERPGRHDRSAGHHPPGR
ncbi:hypothetical protein G6F50_017395 [Rhizopus delemar]|uniref:Uncharacterized protein n=1 Tax=Rhizopus delemar TaxID=936053 RepID=A0A9P6XQR8_9FUNG|nr:hypothetical protein G6F50_017395 [Rhizopus delemar]